MVAYMGSLMKKKLGGGGGCSKQIDFFVCGSDGKYNFFLFMISSKQAVL